jgi:hypothetical protein
MHLRKDIIKQNWSKADPVWRKVFFDMHENPTFENAVAIYDEWLKDEWSGKRAPSHHFFAWISNPTQELITYIKLREV